MSRVESKLSESHVIWSEKEARPRVCLPRSFASFSFWRISRHVDTVADALVHSCLCVFLYAVGAAISAAAPSIYVFAFGNAIFILGITGLFLLQVSSLTSALEGGTQNRSAAGAELGLQLTSLSCARRTSSSPIFQAPATVSSGPSSLPCLE